MPLPPIVTAVAGGLHISPSIQLPMFLRPVSHRILECTLHDGETVRRLWLAERRHVRNWNSPVIGQTNKDMGIVEQGFHSNCNLEKTPIGGIALYSKGFLCLSVLKTPHSATNHSITVLQLISPNRSLLDHA
jgi:hypothetical protein